MGPKKSKKGMKLSTQDKVQTKTLIKFRFSTTKFKLSKKS